MFISRETTKTNEKGWNNNEKGWNYDFMDYCDVGWVQIWFEKKSSKIGQEKFSEYNGLCRTPSDMKYLTQHTPDININAEYGMQNAETLSFSKFGIIHSEFIGWIV